jgi:ABC-type lipoprotein release transport system permease subunit
MNIWAIRAILRLELRQLARERAKLLIMALLIALPVASLAFVGTIVTIIEPTVDELVRSKLGDADFSVHDVEPHAKLEEAARLAGDSMCVYRGMDEVAVDGRVVPVEALGICPVDADNLGLARGLTELRDGRFPMNSGEVAISSALARELQLQIGDRVHLSYGAERDIVGLIQDPEDIDSFQLLRTPSVVERGGEQLLLCRSVGEQPSACVTRLRDSGFRVTTESEIRSQADDLTVGFVFVGSWIGFFEAALIIGAAQAISIKRRQRELGLIASIGGRPIHIFTSLLLITLAVATIVSLLGLIVGVLAALLAHPFLDRWNHRLNGPFEVSLLFLSAAGALGVVSSLLAVAFPAWRASRLCVRDALLSFRPDPKRRSFTWIAGAGLMGGSCCLVLFPSMADTIFGATRLLLVPATFVLGMVLTAPTVFRGSQLLCQLRFPLLRLAIRETNRYRGRSSVATVAVFAAMSISVATAIITTSLQRTMENFPAKLRDDQLLLSGPSAPELAQRLRHSNDCHAVAPLVAAYSNGQPLRVRPNANAPSSGRQEWIVMGDQELLRTFAIDEKMPGFSDGAILSLNPELRGSNLIVTTWLDATPITSAPLVSTSAEQPIAGPLYFVDVHSALGKTWQTGPPPNRGTVPWLVRYSRPIDESIRRHVREQVGFIGGTSIESGVTKSGSLRYAAWIAIALSTILGMVVVLSTLALNFTESREEFRVLCSIGAETTQMRVVIGMRAWYLTILGCLLALPSGMIVASSLMQATNFTLQWTVPWSDLALALFLVPIAIGLVAGVCLRPWARATVGHTGATS